MRIGVIIPAYNCERYVADCLRSLQAQTYADWQAYVMDDGSKDGTLAAVEAFSAADPRIRVWHQENHGLVATMNTLLDRLDDSIELVSFLDSDDFIHPETYARLTEALVRNKADVVECRIAHVPEDAHPETTFSRLGQVSETCMNDLSVYWVRRTSPDGWINKQNKLYRRTAIGALRFQPTLSYEDDFFFACEVNAQIRRKVRLDVAFYAYRASPNSTTAEIPFRKYVGATLERIRLSCAVFLNAGRVPAAVEGEYRADLSKDAYRMCLRKNLKKNPDPKLRRELFFEAGAHFAMLERDYSFVPTGLNLLQRMIWRACRKDCYALARILVFLT